MSKMAISSYFGLLSGSEVNSQKQMIDRISSGADGSSGFQSVWKEKISTDSGLTNLQTDIGAQTKDKGFEQAGAKSSDRIAGEESVAAGSAAAKETGDAESKSVDSKEAEADTISAEESKKPSLEADDELIEEAQEVLACIANELLTQISEILGISEEEGASLLEEMNLDPVDLLSADNFNQFVMEALGAEDSLTLITNESQYSMFKEAMELFEQTMEEQLEVVTAEGTEELIAVSDLIQTDLAVETEDLVSASDEEGEIVPAADSEEVSSVTTQDGDTFGMRALLRSRERQESNQSEGEMNQQGQQNTQTLFDLNPQTVQAEELARPVASYSDTQMIANQILDFIKTDVSPDVSQLEMQLHPANLGTLQIQIANKGGVMTANFVTTDEQVKSALETQMIELRERFEEQGLKVEAIEVTVSAHQFEQNLEQGNDGNRQSEQNESGSRRIRRVSLNVNMETEEIDNLEQEEKIAVEMMQANGGTVDFLA